MSFIITILAALLVFSAVIAIHEFGHFTVAKLCGIQVNEFSIGMGSVCSIASLIPSGAVAVALNPGATSFTA